MLDYLKVENFAVVEKAEIYFSPNLNVLTGETGAGKSIVIGAINHLLKKKIADNAIRGEAGKMVVEAMFSEGDDEFILRREIVKRKSFCYINGELVPFSQLKEKSESLLNIYGQNEHVFLLNPGNHRLFLDQFSHNDDILKSISIQYRKLNTLISELDELKHKSERASESLDFIHFQINEIEELKMEKGDDAHLEQRQKILSSAEDILTRSKSMVRNFYQKDSSLYNIISDHLKDMQFLKEIYPELGELNEELNRFYNLLPELSSTLSNIAGSVDYDDDELNRIENRLLKLNRLKAKYHMDLDQLLQKKIDLVAERDLLADMDFSLQEKQKEISEALTEYIELNSQLRKKREKHAVKLSKMIEQELTRLEMPRSKFKVNIDETQPEMDNISAKGTDKVEFYFTTNPGQPLGRIRDVASGGELSRLMLVLKSVLNDSEESTYIFDEIDAGIGGKTAEFVGEKLKRISENNQVICISHLPQIASFADNHFLVSKEFKKSQTYSNVRELTGDDKVRELGRMMVGSDVNGAVLEAAQNLLIKNKNAAVKS